jgi:hypothetical protein
MAKVMVTAEVTTNTTTKAMRIGVAEIIATVTRGIVATENAATKNGVTRNMVSVSTDADIGVTTITITSSCMSGMTNTEGIFRPDLLIGTGFPLVLSANSK